MQKRNATRLYAAVVLGAPLHLTLQAVRVPLSSSCQFGDLHKTPDKAGTTGIESDTHTNLSRKAQSSNCRPARKHNRKLPSTLSLTLRPSKRLQNQKRCFDTFTNSLIEFVSSNCRTTLSQLSSKASGEESTASDSKGAFARGLCVQTHSTLVPCPYLSFCVCKQVLLFWNQVTENASKRNGQETLQEG